MQPAFLRNSVSAARRADGRVDRRVRRRMGAARPTAARSTSLPEMMRLGLRIASRTLFGTDISGDADAIGGAYRTAFEYVSLKMNARLMFQPLWLPTPRNREFTPAKALLDRVVLELIARRRHEAAQSDVLGPAAGRAGRRVRPGHERRATEGRSDHAADCRSRDDRRGLVLELVFVGQASRDPAAASTTRSHATWAAGCRRSRTCRRCRWPRPCSRSRCGFIRRPGACRARRSGRR